MGAIEVVNLAEQFSRIGAPWQPRIAGEVNDAYVKLGKFHGGDAGSHVAVRAAGLVAGLDAVGTKRFITSTANLAWALDSVNHAHWQADEPQIAEWAKRGAPTRKVVTVEAGRIVHEEDVQPPENPFEHSAQFGFAIYSEALNFSRKQNVPIVTDE